MVFVRVVREGKFSDGMPELRHDPADEKVSWLLMLVRDMKWLGHGAQRAQ